MKYACPCGYEYDPAVGDPDNGIAPAPPSRICPRTSSAPSADWVRTPLRRKTDPI